MPRRRGASGASHGRLGPALRRRVRCGPGGELGVRLFIAGPEAPHVWPRIGIHDSRGARQAPPRCGGARSGGLKSSVGHVQARSPSATASRLLKLQEDVQKPSLAPAFNQELVDLFFEAKDLGFVVETSASASDNPDRNPTVGEKIGIWRQGMSKVGSSPRFEGGL